MQVIPLALVRVHSVSIRSFQLGSLQPTWQVLADHTIDLGLERPERDFGVRLI